MDVEAERIRDYLLLARQAHKTRQSPGRDRFLLLAAWTAAESGYLDLAESCRKCVVRSQPRHLMSRYETMADALRDPDCTGFLTSLNRFCSREQAEHLVARNRLSSSDPERFSDWANRLIEQLCSSGGTS